MEIRTFEEELEGIEPTIRRLTTLFLLGKKIVVKGKENFVKTGPSIIVGNHIGSFKDIAVLFKIIPKPIFFTANKVIFDKEEFNFLIRKHLKRHFKHLGLVLNLILTPIKSLFINFISTNIGKVGTIPVDFSSGYQGKKAVLKKWEEYLQQGRTVVILQGRGRMMKKDPHPYVYSFKKGFSILASYLFKQGISVPVTPLAILGTHFPFMVPAKIKVNVGSSMYVNDYLTEREKETIEKFKNALEARVKALFLELIP